jgi:hypothetical protein
MKVRRSSTASRQYKAVKRCQPCVEMIDLIFKPGHLLVRNSQELRVSPLPFWPAQVRTDVKKIVLNMPQKLMHVLIVHVQIRDADHGVRFIDASVGGYAEMKFR